MQWWLLHFLVIPSVFLIKQRSHHPLVCCSMVCFVNRSYHQLHFYRSSYSGLTFLRNRSSHTCTLYYCECYSRYNSTERLFYSALCKMGNSTFLSSLVYRISTQSISGSGFINVEPTSISGYIPILLVESVSKTNIKLFRESNSASLPVSRSS